MKRLIELKKRELEYARRQKFEAEKKLELTAKELEALKQIEKLLEEIPTLKDYITVREVDYGDNPKIKMG